MVKVDVKPERRNSLTEKDREELMGIRDEDTDDEIDEEQRSHDEEQCREAQRAGELELRFQDLLWFHNVTNWSHYELLIPHP